MYDSDKETIVDKSPVLTYGKLEYTFYCLDSGHEYWPKLVIENDEGYVVEKFTDSAYIPNYRIINCEEQVPQLDFVDSMFDAKDLSYKSSIEMGPNSDKLYVYKKNIWYTINKNSGNPTYHEDNKYSLVAISENDTGSSKDLPIKDYNILNRRDYVYVYRFIKGSHPGNVYQIKKIAQDICWYGWTLAETRQTIIEDKIAYSIDSDNIWRFKYNVSTGAQVQNIIKQQQDTIGKYPKFFSGKKNVISGQVTCLLGKDFACANYVNNEYRYEDSSGEIIINKTDGSIKNIGGYNDGTDVNNMFDFTSKFSVDFLNKWRKVCYSGNPKILRDEKGQAFIVQIYDTSNQTNEQWNGMAETISFSWTEIGSIDGVSVIYTKDGDDGRLYPSETLYPNITLFPTE